jgi:hypothetical protein
VGMRVIVGVTGGGVGVGMGHDGAYHNRGRADPSSTPEPR